MDVLNKHASRLAISKYNTLRHWNSYEEYIASGYRGRVNIRDPRSSTRLMIYGVNAKAVPKELAKIPISKHLLFFNETAPDEFLTMQGELVQGSEGLELTYSFDNVTNRRMLNFMFARGLKAQIIIQQFMDGASLEEMQEIMRQYPDHVVEFSTYSIKTGLLQHNTLIWDIRKY